MKLMEEIKKILVGFSGGVDSTTAVDILRKKGFQVTAVFFKMFPEQKTEEVQLRADNIGVELIIKDISNIFKDCIIKGFLNEYQNNKIPNPCVKCNYEIKFKFLLKIADELKIEKIATGHYAQIKKNKKGKFELWKGLDKKKDQSYFLYPLTQKELARIVFPLGDKQKREIKKQALKNNWFEKIEESQDVCFLNGSKDVKEFLAKNLDDEKQKKGEIKNEEGEVLGEHQGLIFYTQGQRKSLDLPNGPFYVIRKNLRENVLMVSKNKNHPELVNREICLKQVNWIREEPIEAKEYFFKSRYRAKLVKGTIKKTSYGWKAELIEHQWAVAEGQSLVVYEGDRVLGGGIIKSFK